jgi:hypothetical protein
MTTPTIDRLVADYLARLERAARVLPPGRRAELLEEIRDHITTARAAGAAADEAAVRTMLDRLGEPEEIVAAARETDLHGTAPPGMAAARPGTGVELGAVLLMTLGSLIPLLGWAAGAVLLWTARRWTTREKLLGTLVVPGGPGLALWLASYGGQSCYTVTDSSGAVIEQTCTGFAFPPWLGVPLFAAMVIAPLVVAGILMSRARARAAAEPPVLRPARPGGASAWSGPDFAAVLLLALGGLIVFLAIFLVGVFPILAGLALVWSSRTWTRQEQLIGTVILAAVPAVLITGLALATSEFDTDRVYRGLQFGVGLGAAAAAVYLAVTLNRRT